MDINKKKRGLGYALAEQSIYIRHQQNEYMDNFSRRYDE